MSRRGAIVFLTVFVGFLVVVTTAKAAALLLLGHGNLEPHHGDGHHRVVGRGQVRFDGAGPEKWAFRFRRERGVVNTLRRQLTDRLARLVYLVDAFECVHRYEGAWSAHTGNGYYGGLQMDLGFQRAYGRELLAVKGTADHWSPSEQIAVAIVAHADRGFEPWPNTARMCGLR